MIHITITGSNVVATNDVNLNAQNNITIQSAQATHDETHYAEEEHSGFTASSSSIGYGSSSLETTNDTQQVINVGSTVGSVQGDVNINAGSQYTQTASDLMMFMIAAKHNILLDSNLMGIFTVI